MYCHACGQPIIAGSAFCPHCGQAQGAPSPPARRPYSTVPSALIVLALVFFFPLGLILMWTACDWDPDVKWGVSGLFFPPLWLHFLWKVWWLPYAVGAGLAALILNGVAGGGLPDTAGIVLLVIIALILLATRPRPTPKPKPVDPSASLRAAIEDKLELCHDLIAAIERGVALDLQPAEAPARRLYTSALASREEALRLFRPTASRADLLRADERISRALSDLRAVQDGLSDASPFSAP